VMASVYALRMFIRAMHNRTGPHVDSREISLLDSVVLVPLVAVILFLALYPQLALHRSERTVRVAVARAQVALRPGFSAEVGLERELQRTGPVVVTAQALAKVQTEAKGQ